MGCKRLQIAASALALASCFGAPATVLAQVLVQRFRTDLPTVSRVFPVGIQRGRIAEVTISGERLEGLSAILGPPGVRLVRIVEANDKQAKLELEAGADAAPGFFPLHLLCKAGLSNPKLLAIDSWPQTNEQEDNNKASAATAISVGASVNAVLGKADVDYYRFEVQAGESLVFDIEAQRLGSALSPAVTLYDASGRELHRALPSRSSIGQETRFSHFFPSPGTYLVRINDRLYAGSDASVYRLRIGKIPFAASMFPLGGQRGVKTSIALSGGSLSQPINFDVDLSGDIAWQRKQLTIPFGSENLLSPALFAVGEYPEAVEQEPNNAREQAQAITAPVTFNGCIDPPGDCDSVRFHAKLGEKLTVRVLAQQLGSPVDSMISITDASGKEVLAADDRQPSPREWPVVRPLNAPQLLDDVLVEFAAPGEGDYVLSIEDRYGHGGPAYAYRVELAPAAADFELVMQPGLPPNPRDPKAVQQQGQVMQEFSGAGTGALTLDRGGAATLLVRAFRNGYNGPISLKVEGLPEGVQAGPGLIPAGQNDTTLNLIADFEAPATAAWVRVLGSGQVDQNATNASAVRIERAAQQPIVWSALPASGAVEQEFPAVALGISQLGAELAIRGILASTVVPGQSVPLRVAIKRREGYAGEVSIELLNLPTGLSGGATKIEADRSDVEIQLIADSELAPGKHLFQLEGTLAVADKKEPIKAVFPVEFEAFPPVSLELAAQQVEVPRGGSAKVELVLHRHGPIVVPVELTLLQLPRGLAAAQTAIPAEAERFELTIQADEKAVASPIRRIVQIKAKTKLGDREIELPTLRFAVKVVKGP